MIKIQKKGKARKPGSLASIAGAKPPKQKNPSVVSQRNKQSKPITLAKVGPKT